MSGSGSSGGDERRSVEVNAPTVDEAVARGLVRLGGLGRDEVKIEVLSEGRSGLLGFGAEEARVRLSTLLPGETASGPPAPSTGKGRPAETEAKQQRERPQRQESQRQETQRQETRRQEPRREEPQARPKPEREPEPRREAPAAKDEGKRPAASGDALRTASEVVETLLAKMGFEESGTERKSSLLPVDIEGEDSLVLSIHGPGTERLTHKDGRGLQALQFVSRLVLSRKMGQWQNLLLDVDDDRARRIKEIYMMAEQSAELVEREGRPVSLPPMTAYERRVVHLALREHDSIATQSIGRGPGRKVTVRRKDDLLPDL